MSRVDAVCWTLSGVFALLDAALWAFVLWVWLTKRHR